MEWRPSRDAGSRTTSSATRRTSEPRASTGRRSSGSSRASSSPARGSCVATASTSRRAGSRTGTCIPAAESRRILHGALTIDRGDGDPRTYSAGESWHEGADDPVLATASATEDTAFVRVLLLPAEWAGRRTITYVDPADEDKPRLQRATILLEVAL